ncbi:MAG: MarR family transcriptional regulator [Flavobacteriales bacterium]|nr:MarR family transcriptional regulator [Flavobacteriales bacterium]
MKPEETIDFHIRWLWAKISRLYNAEASKHDGSMSIGYVLLNIDKEGTFSTKLGPKMGMESRSLTRTLKTMEENELIERRTDPDDRRMVRVFLTDKGQAMREESKRTVLELNEHVRNNIDPEKFAVFLDVVKEMNRLVDKPGIFKNRTTHPTHPIPNEKN